MSDLKLIDILDKLKSFKWGEYNVKYVVLFGSLAKRGEGNDIDIAISRIDSEKYFELLLKLQDYLDTEKNRLSHDR
jgi:predicted nucleotidyltransferase